MKRIDATEHRPGRAACTRAVVPLALAGLLLAPVLGWAAPRASASTPRPAVLLNDSGTALTQTTLLSAPFHAAGPVTVAWKVAAADAAGIRSRFAVALLDAQGHTRARLVDTTRAGRASATIDRACKGGCSLRISVANMDYALVGYTTGAAR